MPTRLYNGERPAGGYLDVDECVRLVIYLGVEKRAGRLPRWAADIYASLAPIAMAATGHDPDATSSGLAVDGHGFDAGQSGVVMLDVKQLADLLGISQRHARRKCEQIGQKVGGRWIVDRRSIEMVRASNG